MQSANYVRSELPVRIAHRIRDIQALPYVVVTQESIAKVYEVRQSALFHQLNLTRWTRHSYTGPLLRSLRIPSA